MFTETMGTKASINFLVPALGHPLEYPHCKLTREKKDKFIYTQHAWDDTEKDAVLLQRGSNIVRGYEPNYSV